MNKVIRMLLLIGNQHCMSTIPEEHASDERIYNSDSRNSTKKKKKSRLHLDMTFSFIDDPILTSLIIKIP